jgi:Sec-independent protein secretion pathway component TatC
MLALAVPMTLLFLIAVLIGYIVQRRRRKSGDNDADDD